MVDVKKCFCYDSCRCTDTGHVSTSRFWVHWIDIFLFQWRCTEGRKVFMLNWRSSEMILIIFSITSKVHICFLFLIVHNLETCKTLQVGRIQVTAFQSSDGKQNHTLRPVSVSPVPKSSVVEIESSLSSSEKILPRSGSSRRDGTDEDTGDSKASSGFYKVIPWSFRNVNSFMLEPLISHYFIFIASDWLGWGKIIRPRWFFCQCWCQNGRKPVYHSCRCWPYGHVREYARSDAPLKLGDEVYLSMLLISLYLLSFGSNIDYYYYYYYIYFFLLLLLFLCT